MLLRNRLIGSIAKIFILPVIAVLCLSGCTNGGVGSAPLTLKIGLVAPFEGSHRPLGYEALFGVKLALQERNAAQGIHGYRIELVALNDFDDPLEAQIQAEALVADPDVLGVVGHLSSAATLAALPIYQEAQLAVSIPWSIATARIDQTGVVEVAANYNETSAYLDTISREWGFNNRIEVIDRTFPALAPETEALYLNTDGVTAGEILLALEQANISLPLFGQVEVGSSQTVQVAKKAANDLIFVSPGPDPQHGTGAASFIEAYQALAGFPPGPRAVLAYDATQVLLDAIEQTVRIINHRPARAEVSTTIANVQRQGISGEIKFDAQGRRINAPVWVYQISEEKYPGVLVTSE